MTTAKTTWNTHDFVVKMLDWTSGRGSKLAYTCRRCGRKFCHYSLGHEAWAIDASGQALNSTVSENLNPEPIGDAARPELRSLR